MKKKFLMIAAVSLALSVAVIPTESQAAGSGSAQSASTASATTRKTVWGWVKQNGKYYFYRRNGEIKYGWVSFCGKRYYADPITGIRQTGWQTINGKRYYFRKKDGVMLRDGLWKISGKLYYFQHNGRPATGWQTINGRTYYFGEDGAALKGFQEIDGYTYYFRSKQFYQLKGWYRIGGKKYHFNKTDSSRPVGAMDTGLVTISGKQYFFGEDGAQITDDFDANGYHYSFDGNGRCTLTPIPQDDPSMNNGGEENSNNGTALSDDFLFFTVYESGRGDDFYAGYAQTGGDNGNACGKYQFDYRYSLLPFVKYCYSKDPVFFAEFKSYASLSLLEKSKLKGNTKFYAAWKAIYAKSKITFANYQDMYAKQEYYDVTERYLLNYGIDISSRPDVVKGAVYSYSIQHGQLTAANAVVAAKITNATSNTNFLKKLYSYRIEKYPSYKSRYTSERTEALRRLSLAS